MMTRKKREIRSLNLIADFVDGYASGWKFAVGECFKDELDIKYTDRIIDGKKTQRWTQGCCYHFSEGNIIYDTRKAFQPWHEALKHITLICNVIRGIPNFYDQHGNLIDGTVSFTLSKPNKTKDHIEMIGHHTLTQNEFVHFLKTGVM
jgi:hypothetical protein